MSAAKAKEVTIKDGVATYGNVSIIIADLPKGVQGKSETSQKFHARLKSTVIPAMDGLHLKTTITKKTFGYILCSESGCDIVRRVYKSDVHQVTRCSTHQKQYRNRKVNEAARKRREASGGKAKPKAKKTAPKKAVKPATKGKKETDAQLQKDIMG